MVKVVFCCNKIAVLVKTRRAKVTYLLDFSTEKKERIIRYPIYHKYAAAARNNLEGPIKKEICYIIGIQ